MECVICVGSCKKDISTQTSTTSVSYQDRSQTMIKSGRVKRCKYRVLSKIRLYILRILLQGRNSNNKLFTRFPIFFKNNGSNCFLCVRRFRNIYLFNGCITNYRRTRSANWSSVSIRGLFFWTPTGWESSYKESGPRLLKFHS